MQMDFYAVLDQVVALLHQRGRVTYRALQRQFALDDETLTDLKEELLYAHPHVADDEGRGLVWTGEREKSEESLVSRVQGLESKTAKSPDPRHQTLDSRPVSYTPPH